MALERKCETRESPHSGTRLLESLPLTAAATDATEPHCGPQERLSTLAIGAIGVVFGDIGTFAALCAEGKLRRRPSADGRSRPHLRRAVADLLDDGADRHVKYVPRRAARR